MTILVIFLHDIIDVFICYITKIVLCNMLILFIVFSAEIVNLTKLQKSINEKSNEIDTNLYIGFFI